MKKKLFAVSFLTVVVMLVLSACSASNSKYFKEIDEYVFWSNDASQAVPQTNVRNIIDDHMANENGKEKKILFIGFDGTRADGLINLIQSGVKDKDSKDNDLSGAGSSNPIFSGINKLNATGGVYQAYAGGEKGKETQQHPSTAPGWTALTTGVWGIKNGVTDNGMYKNLDYKTFMLDYAEKENYSSVFTASWGEHFEKTYKNEIDYLKTNTSIPMIYNRVTSDQENHAYLLSALTEGSEDERDLVFGIYEAPDYAGHSTGFGNQNYRYTKAILDSDARVYDLLTKVESRPSYAEEDWLILMSTDHGGIGKSHGGQSLEERNIWVACNKEIDSKYFSANYNGFILK